MKNRLSLLIATLIFGCSSFSYASEKKEENNTANWDDNFNLEFFPNKPSNGDNTWGGDSNLGLCSTSKNIGSKVFDDNSTLKLSSIIDFNKIEEFKKETKKKYEEKIKKIDNNNSHNESYNDDNDDDIYDIYDKEIKKKYEEETEKSDDNNSHNELYDDNNDGDVYDIFYDKDSIWNTNSKTNINNLDNMSQQSESDNLAMQNQIESYNSTINIYHRTPKEKLVGYLNIFSEDTGVIPTIDMLNITNFNVNEFSRFKNKRANVIDFRDCLGRKYKNVILSTIDSRIGNVLYSSEFKYTKLEKEQAKDLLKTITKIYTQYFPHKRSLFSDPYKLDYEENQIEKTKLIHFIEDVIIKCIYAKNLSIYPYNSSSVLSYNKLFGTLNYLCNYENGKYLNKIMQAWNDYLNPNKPFEDRKLIEDTDLEKIKTNLSNHYSKFAQKRKKFFNRVKHQP